MSKLAASAGHFDDSMIWELFGASLREKRNHRLMLVSTVTGSMVFFAAAVYSLLWKLPDNPEALIDVFCCAAVGALLILSLSCTWRILGEKNVFCYSRHSHSRHICIQACALTVSALCLVRTGALGSFCIITTAMQLFGTLLPVIFFSMIGADVKAEKMKNAAIIVFILWCCVLIACAADALATLFGAPFAHGHFYDASLVFCANYAFIGINSHIIRRIVRRESIVDDAVIDDDDLCANSLDVFEREVDAVGDNEFE